MAVEDSVLTPSDPGTARHIDRIYRAAVAPEHWPVFLDALREELRAASIHLLFRLPSDGDQGVDVSRGMDERSAEAYRSHFYRLNPLRLCYPEAEEGTVLVGESVIAESELARTEFYNDWMRSQGIAHSLVAFLYKPAQVASTLVGFREKSRGPLEKDDFDRIRPLVPHLQRALTIQRRVGAAELRAGAAEEALDRISSGVILLDERGAPIATNRTADGILAMNDGLVLDRDGPSASTPKQTGELRGLVSGAAATGAGKGTNPGGVMRLARPSGRPALEAVVTPIRCESSPLFDRKATSAIFLAAPDARAECPPQRLRRIFGLTPMEAKVASRIASGMTLGEISDAFGVTIHTVRGHLKELFRKTDTHRQVELVRVLLTGLADLRLE